MPFTRYFYHKKDTPADTDWKRKAKDRNNAAARELGGYQAYGEFGWNDELLVGDKITEPTSIVDLLTKDAVMSVDEDAKEASKEDLEAAVDKPFPRHTEADDTKDTKRLDRKLARTLYLCVQREKSGWGFPAGTLVGRENLHQVFSSLVLGTANVEFTILTMNPQAAERILVQAAGPNMNTWIVGNVPIGHHVRKLRSTTDGAIERQGEKTFFLRGRIMAGQADLKENLFGLSDYKWLTKQEVEKHVAPKYFSQVKNMMSDR
jgi:large subunit ribosomal protein L46